MLAEGLRYPTGWADPPGDGAVFFTDNQGQQKTTCEIDRLVAGGWYGYPSQADSPAGPAAIARRASDRPDTLSLGAVGQRPGIRRHRGQVRPARRSARPLRVQQPLHPPRQPRRRRRPEQGACYPFLENLLGPLCLAFAPDGSLYVGSLREPAWGGEPEQGAVFRVTYSGQPAFGIQEVKARPDGFALTLLLDPSRPARRRPTRSGTRSAATTTSSRASYHSPPTDEETLHVNSAVLQPDGRTVRLVVLEPLIADRIYEIRTTLPSADPPVAHYTMNRVPR